MCTFSYNHLRFIIAVLPLITIHHICVLLHMNVSVITCIEYRYQNSVSLIFQHCMWIACAVKLILSIGMYNDGVE